MERLNCVFIKNNIMEFLDEAKEQLDTGMVCFKCNKQCDKNTKCYMAMKNLLTDIRIFMDAYTDANPLPEVEVEEI